MMRFLILLASLIVGCVSCVTHVQGAPSNVVRSIDLVDKTVALVNSGGAYCSGVWVSHARILTANHCVSRTPLGGEVKYITHDDLSAKEEITISHFAQLEARDAAHDLALLKNIESNIFHALASAAPVNPSQGDFVQTMGHPLGLLYSYSNGVVSAIRWDSPATGGGEMWFVQATAPISPGNSGCGLFNGDGELVGLAHATYVYGENLNIFIHRIYIEEFLKGRLSPALVTPTLTPIREGRGEAVTP